MVDHSKEILDCLLAFNQTESLFRKIVGRSVIEVNDNVDDFLTEEEESPFDVIQERLLNIESTLQAIAMGDKERLAIAQQQLKELFKP